MLYLIQAVLFSSIACFFEQLLLIGTHASFGILFNEFQMAYSSSATIISFSLSVQTIVLSLLCKYVFILVIMEHVYLSILTNLT